MPDPDPSIYEKNAALLRERYPGFLENIEIALDDPARPENRLEFEFLTGKKGYPTFAAMDRNGRKVYGHSTFDPIREAEKKFEEFVGEKWDRVIVYGFGFGYHVDYLLKHTEDRTIAVVEPCIRVFHEALRRVDVTSIFSTRGFMLTFTTNAAELGFFISSGVSPINMPEYRNVELPYIELIPEIKTMRREALSNFRDELMFNLFTNRLGGPIMWKNMIKNFAHVSRSPGLNKFEGCMEGRPVFVVAPGPSLERNVKQLHRVKGRALIIAVDTATRILNRHGIRPDAIVSVDFQRENYDKLKGVDTSDAYLLPAIEVCPDIPASHTGRIISYYHANNVTDIYDPIIGPRGSILSGGSVLCDAVYLALKFGADPLVLMGVDLGFPGKRWYADGSFEDGSFTRDIHEGRVDLMEIPDIFGNPLYTYKSFYAFLNVLNSLFPRLKIKVLDATEGGAAITGSETVTAEEAVDAHVTDGFDPVAALDEIYSEFEPVPRDEIAGKIDEIIERFEATLKIVERGLKYAEKALALSEHFDKKKSAFTKQVQKLISIKERVREKSTELDFLGPMIDQAMAQIFHQDTDAITDAKATPEEKKRAYRTVVDLEQKLYFDMKTAINQLKEHFEELKTEMSKEADCEKTV